jgi:hypothetical protein
MRKLILVLPLLFCIGCAPDKAEIQRVSTTTCSIMKESSPSDRVARVKLINEAREKLKIKPFTEGDSEILTSIKWGTCELLVSDSPSYKTKTKEHEDEYSKKMQEIAAEAEKLAADLKAQLEVERERINKASTVLCITAEVITIGRLFGSRTDKEVDAKVKSLFTDEGVTDDSAKHARNLILIRQSVDKEAKSTNFLSSEANCINRVLPETCEVIAFAALAEPYDQTLFKDFLIRDLSNCSR